MKCIIAIAFAMLLYSLCIAQTIEGRIHYPSSGVNGTIPCPPTLTGTEVYPMKVTLKKPNNSTEDQNTASDGKFTFLGVPAGNISLTPFPQYGGINAWKNGVNIDDKAILEQHILNITPILCPFRLIAGDMNYSGTLSTLDLIAIQRIINNSTTPDNRPWWTIHKSLVLPDFNPDPIFFDTFWSSNPFNAKTNRNGKYLGYGPGAPSWMNNWEISTSSGVTDPLCTEKYSFFIIKRGDVNGDAQLYNIDAFQPFRSPSADPTVKIVEKTGPELRTTQAILANERYEVKISALSSTHSICAYQVGLKFDTENLRFEKTKKTKESLLKQSEDDFTTNPELLEKGDFRSSWTIDYAVDKTGFAINREVELFSFNIKAKKELAKISEAVLLDQTNIETLFFNYDVKPIKDVKLFISIRQLRPDEE